MEAAKQVLVCARLVAVSTVVAVVAMFTLHRPAHVEIALKRVVAMVDWKSEQRMPVVSVADSSVADVAPVAVAFMTAGLKKVAAAASAAATSASVAAATAFKFSPMRGGAWIAEVWMAAL